MAVFGWIVLLLLLGGTCVMTGAALYGVALFGGVGRIAPLVWLAWVALVIWLLKWTAPFTVVTI